MVINSGAKNGRDFNIFLNSKRIRESTLHRDRDIDQFYSDRSRILFSSSFRRLQQKSQVFSLEPNASVRSRLTHSLEVSDLGRTLANRIAFRLVEEGDLCEENIPALVAVVENACLLHDIGNPPFGHFGEAAIKDWAKNELEDAISDETGKLIEDGKNALYKQLMSDFYEFDGNPQGLRVITRLHTDHDEHSLNLTYATLLCSIKYPRVASNADDLSSRKTGSVTYKKAGYFNSEENLVKGLYSETEIELGKRYPFVYIMEAADDIAYCMSDIADGIEKRILTEEEFLYEFQEEWSHICSTNKELPVKVPKRGEMKGFNQDISIPWSREAMKAAVEQFIDNREDICKGIAGSLISDASAMGRVLETMKRVSRRILYTSIEAESIEITGYAVILGILRKYSCLLKMSFKDFDNLVKKGSVTGAAFDYQRRLFNRLGKRCIRAYIYAVDKLRKVEKEADTQHQSTNDNLPNSSHFTIKEWWLRVHLIIDHVSGMTDEFALETYQMLEGINLMR